MKQVLIVDSKEIVTNRALTVEKVFEVCQKAYSFRPASSFLGIATYLKVLLKDYIENQSLYPQISFGLLYPVKLDTQERYLYFFKYWKKNRSLFPATITIYFLDKESTLIDRIEISVHGRKNMELMTLVAGSLQESYPYIQIKIILVSEQSRLEGYREDVGLEFEV